MAWDDVAGKAMGGRRDKYVVLQVVRTEKQRPIIEYE